MNFSEKLIRLRKREGISQEELASYLEVSRQAVSRWEQGTALPDAGNLWKLRQRFGVSVDWLLEDAKGRRCLTDRQRRKYPKKRFPRCGKESCPGLFRWGYLSWDCCFWEFLRQFFRRNM